MSVEKNKRGTGYVVRHRVHGKRRSKVVRTLRQAEALERLWVDEATARSVGLSVEREPITLAELADEFLDQHVAEANTIQALRDRLKLAVDGVPVKPRAKEREHALGKVRVDRLEARTVGAWRKRLSDGSAWAAHKALRQLLAYAVSEGLVADNVAKTVKNPEPKRREVACFGSWEQVHKLSAKLPPERRSLPSVGTGIGLRPEEWLALERSDFDFREGVLSVRRVYTDGRIKGYGKQPDSLRRIPLRASVVAAVKAHPWRIDTPLMYPSDNGGYLDLHDWRRNEWYPALEAAGLPKLTPYAMRHSFASFSIAAGVSLFYLARLMGTSVEQIDKTYGHALSDSEDYLRGLLDRFDSREADRDGRAEDAQADA